MEPILTTKRSNDLLFQENLCDDPIEMKKLIDMYVKVETSDGTLHFGLVYTVDPVTNSYVLIKPTTEEIEVIPGCSIKKVVEQEAPKDLKTFDVNKFLNHKKGLLVEKDIKKRQTQIISWFRKNLINLEISSHEPSEIILKDTLTIRPPYEADDCLSNNEIILAKMRKILTAMPQDYED